MRVWDEAIQRMIDWLEEHIEDEPTLLDMSKQIGYSPSYCSTQFHRVTGMTLKRYIAGRRLALATLALRDTSQRILDIAIRYGYSSQEALTRAFNTAYGLTPYAYRRNPRPVRLPVKQNVLFPYEEQNGALSMSNENVLTTPGVRVEYIPAHKYIGIWEPEVDAYMDFWSKHDCDTVCGIIESMSHVADPVVTCHTAGWFDRGDGRRGYFYGLGVPADYTGPVPEGFTIKEVPGSYYLVFYHPKFDFLKDCAEVMRRTETLAWGYDPLRQGFSWREGGQTYQRHMPETLGYEVLRPVTR